MPLRLCSTLDVSQRACHPRPSYGQYSAPLTLLRWISLRYIRWTNASMASQIQASSHTSPFFVLSCAPFAYSCTYYPLTRPSSSDRPLDSLPAHMGVVLAHIAIGAVEAMGDWVRQHCEDLQERIVDFAWMMRLRFLLLSGRGPAW